MIQHFNTVIRPINEKLGKDLGLSHKIHVQYIPSEETAGYKWARYGNGTKEIGIQFELAEADDEYCFDGGEDYYRDNER